MKIRELMTKSLETVRPQSNLREAADSMRRSEVGGLPVMEGQRMVGFVTDRDLVIRGMAKGLDIMETKVSDVMSTPLLHVFADEDLSVALEAMKKNKVRRMVVLDEKKEPAGILTLADIAVRENVPEEVSKLLEEISQSR